ncbi:hypothetical protein O0L34_g4616 [Tuta absoluta]|nr:hypothetical protein O0L34_g4616 [Tuta absoluta]
MEAVQGKLIVGSEEVHIIVVYRPPRKNKMEFIKQVETLVEKISPNKGIVLIGDMNIDRMECKTSGTVSHYNTTLCGLGLQCLIPGSAITREAIVDGQLQQSSIDHVWVRETSLTYGVSAHTFACNLSDHRMTGVRLGSDSKQNNCERVCDKNSVQQVLSKRVISS